MSSVVLREVGGLHEGIGGEEAAYLGIIQPRVGINRLYAVVVLMAGEAAVEGERGLGLLDGVPVGTHFICDI